MMKIVERFYSTMSSLMARLNSDKFFVIGKILIRYIKDGEKVLDLGSGTGEIAEFIHNHRKNIEITLLDITSEYNKSKFKVNVYDGEKLPFPKNTFDTVLVSFVLHHSQDPSLTLREAVRVSKNKIIIVEEKIDTKLEFFFIEIWHSLVDVIAGGELFFSFRPKVWFDKEFKRLGLRVKKVTRFRYPPYKLTQHRVYILMQKL